MHSCSETYQSPCRCCVSPGNAVLRVSRSLSLVWFFVASPACNRIFPDPFNTISTPYFYITPQQDCYMKA